MASSAVRSNAMVLLLSIHCFIVAPKIVSKYDQEIPQSQTADNPVAREEEPLPIFMWDFCIWPIFCCAVLSVASSCAIISLGRRELATLL